MDVIALLIFLGVIVLGFLRKVNVGILALGLGAVGLRVLGQKDSALLGGISSSMFGTLVGITLLFAVVNSTGALDLLARKIVALSGDRVWLIPIAIFMSGFIVAGIGPGAIPALAIIPPMAVSVALAVGYNPVMLALIGECGLMAGRMTPITPEATIFQAAADAAGISNVMWVILVCQTIACSVFAVFVYFYYKGYKLKAPITPLSAASLEKISAKQGIALAGIVVMMVLMIGFNVNIGLSAFLVASVLLLMGIADDGACIKALPWSTIVMVLGVGALMTVVDKAGGIELMRNSMSSVMNSYTATPLMGVSAGLLSMVSSALAVVFPTMIPMTAGMAELIGGVHPVALMAAVGIGASLSGVSPISTGGALILAAFGTTKKDFSKEEQNKIFAELLLMSAMSFVVIIIVSFLLFNPLANMMLPM